MRSASTLLILVLAQTWSQTWSQTESGPNWDFGLRLFRSVASRSDQNVLVGSGGSALSLSSVLERSSGRGRQELDQVLGGTQTEGLRLGLNSSGSLGGVAWFVAKRAEPDDAYRKRLEESFGAELHSLDFEQSKSSEDSIQRWVLDKTSDRVLIPRTGLDLEPDPQLVLASAMNLQARFSVPFNSSQTVVERFFVDRYHTVTVPMMLTCGRFFLAYDRTLKTGILRLGLDRNSALVLVLPDEGTALESVEEQLNAQTLGSWRRALKKTRLEVQLPKFSLEKSNLLKQNLKKLQVSQVFAENSLSQVVDAVLLSVDETSAPGGVASSFKTLPPRLTVNRPFLLVVLHEPTGTLQLIGRVVDPTQK